MDHTSRFGIVATIAGVAFFVTGLQKKVVNPVIGWIGLLGLLVAAFVIVGAGIVLRTRRGRAELRAAMATVASATVASATVASATVASAT